MRFLKGVISMRNVGTFHYFEEYRFLFLRYLEVAERLLKLYEELNDVQSYLGIMDEVESFETEKKIYSKTNLSIKIGTILLRFGRGLHEFSLSDIEDCLVQIETEIKVLLVENDYTWESLYQSTIRLWSDESAIWWENDETHRLLFSSDNSVANERIRYYITLLERWDDLPLKPICLEEAFWLHHDGLVHLIPFSRN